MKIIVTGATSMIGVATIDAAIHNGVEVYAIIRENTKRKERLPKSQLIHVLHGTLDTLLQIDGVPDSADVFYHFAWAGTSKMDRDNPYVQEKNIRYTMDAVELAGKIGCKRFVYAGSQAEYGPVEGVIDEDTPFAPLLSYGVAKYTAGLLSKKLCQRKGIKHVWGRIFSVYGPHDNDGTMLDYAIKCLDNDETAKFSSATQFWNYLYETDAGEMFYRLGQNDIPTGTYLIANCESKILKDYIEIMMNEYGDDAKAEFASAGTDRVFGLNVDVSRTVECLNYRPKVNFEKGIKNMIEYRHSL